MIDFVNVETAFLYKDLEKEIYMEFLKGISAIGIDDCTILNKCIYSLAKALWQNICSNCTPKVHHIIMNTLNANLPLRWSVE